MLTIESLFAIVRNSDLISPLEISQTDVDTKTAPDATWSGKLLESIDRKLVMTMRINADDAGFRISSIFSARGKKIARITTLLKSAKTSASGKDPIIEPLSKSLNQSGVSNPMPGLLPVLKISIGTVIMPIPSVKTRSSPK